MSGLIYQIHVATMAATRTVRLTRHKRFNDELAQQINDALAEHGVQLERNPHGCGWRLRSITEHTSSIDTNDNHLATLTLTLPSAIGA